MLNQIIEIKNHQGEISANINYLYIHIYTLESKICDDEQTNFVNEIKNLDKVAKSIKESLL